MEQIPDTEKFIDQVCLSYRHDFGFMDKTQQNRLRFECKEWIRAINSNTKTKPSLGQISDNPPPPPLAEPHPLRDYFKSVCEFIGLPPVMCR